MTGPARPRREFRLPKWSLWACLAFLGAIGLLYAVAWIVVDPLAATERATERLRARGFATTVAEWNAPPVPAEENGAPEIDAADDWLVATHGGRDAWKCAGPWRNDLPEPWWEHASARDMVALDHFLAALEPYFARLEAAVARPRLHWPADAQFALPEIARLQRINALLHASARRDAATADRLRAVAIPLRIARKVDRPVLITGMVVGAMSGSAVKDLRALVTSGAVPAADARRALDEDLRMDLSSRIPGMVRGEIVWALEVHRAAYSGRDDGAGGEASFVPRLDAPAARVVAMFLGGPAEMFDACEQAAAVSETSVAARVRHFRALEAGASKYARVGLVMWPAMPIRLARADAALRLARVALAVKERHESSGRWPASLDELRDTFPDGPPLDPFTDASFVYDVRDGAVRIASTGRIAGDEPVSEADLQSHGLVWEFTR